MKKIFLILNIVFISLTGVILIALQLQPMGWLFLLAGLISLFFCSPGVKKDFLLVYLGLALLAIAPINTDLGFGHVLTMGLILFLAVALPYLISKHIYQDDLVSFPWHHGRNWFKPEIFYLGLAAAAIGYFSLPLYLKNTGAYLNWLVEPGSGSLVGLLVAIGALGVWDEIFFSSVIFRVLKRHLPFMAANFIRALLFSVFLYQLGFTSWGFILIFIFAWSQGYIFNKTNSLFYVTVIHLTLDLILFLALISAYYPDWLPIFIT